MKHTIIALVGPSGAGKTTISMAMAKAGIPYVVSYTTRPMREGETDGVEHFFVSKLSVALMRKSFAKSPYIWTEMVPAYTEIGGHSYFVKASQLLEHPVVSYVIDEVGLIGLMDWCDSEFRNVSIVPMYVDRDSKEIAKHTDAERMARDMERTALPEDTYTIRVVNDSPSLDQLNYWAENFAFALKTVLGATSVHPCSLHTSEDRMHDIVNKLNNVQHHD